MEQTAQSVDRRGPLSLLKTKFGSGALNRAPCRRLRSPFGRRHTGPATAWLDQALRCGVAGCCCAILGQSVLVLRCRSAAAADWWAELRLVAVVHLPYLRDKTYAGGGGNQCTCSAALLLPGHREGPRALALLD